MATTTYVEISAGLRALGARTDFAGAAVTDLSAEEDRYSNIVFSQGVLKPSDAFVPAAGAAATMNVTIGSGAAKTDYYVVEGQASGQGNYIVRLEDTSETVTLSAASAQDRIDEVYLVVRDDTYDASSRGLPVLARRQGDAAASPTAPGPDSSWDAYALLATILVPNSATDIEDCTVTDSREAVELAATVAVPHSISDHFQMGAAASSTGSAMSASLVDKVSVTFNKPTDWNTYTIMLWGSATGEHAGSGGPGGVASAMSARAEIGSSLGTTYANALTVGEFAGLGTIGVNHVAAGLTAGSVLLAVAAAQTTGTVRFESGSLQYIAIRTS